MRRQFTQCLHPFFVVPLLLGLAIWGFARAYYFAFYVIEHYVDESYKYSGLLDFLRYALKRRGPPGAGDGTSRGEG